VGNINKLSIMLAVFLITLFLFSAAKAEQRIGILTFSDQARYSEALKGFLEQMRADGWQEPKTTYRILNSQGSKASMAEQVRQLSLAKLDLIFTLGTVPTIAIAKAIKDTPIVFAVVYDPVKAGIAAGWASSGSNVTGVTSLIPMSRLMAGLKEFRHVKRMAVLYKFGEKNSEIQLQDLQLLQSQYKIEVIPVSLSKPEDVPQLLPEVVRSVDALYLTGSSVVGEAAPTIVDIANKARVVTITHLDDLMDKGALLGICGNSYLQGRLAGKKATQVLRGRKPAAIPIESLKNVNYILNSKTAKAGKFHIPPAFMRQVDKVIE